MCKSQGGYSRFQVTGMIAGFLGFEIFDLGIFFVGKFGKYFFLCVCVCVCVGLDLNGNVKWGFFGVFKTI